MVSCPPLVHPPMTMIALSLTVAIATADLGDDNDAVVFLHELVDSSYILIPDVVVLLLYRSRPPITTGRDELGTRAV